MNSVLRKGTSTKATENDPKARRLLGNFSQAFSHVGLINTARSLTKSGGPA
jgi:hypothetical protein